MENILLPGAVVVAEATVIKAGDKTPDSTKPADTPQEKEDK